MNSEKVKKIKEKLQEEIFIANGFGDKLRKVPTKELEDILTLINELESENERLVESCKNCHYIKDLEIANGHAKELKDRIAELEKENGELLKENEGWHGSYRCAIDKIGELSAERYIKVEQFAERLKEKMYEKENSYIEFLSGKNAVSVDIVDFENCLDETLKEFL